MSSREKNQVEGNNSPGASNVYLPTENKAKAEQNLLASQTTKLRGSQYLSRLNDELPKDRLRQQTERKKNQLKESTIKIDEFTRKIITKTGQVFIHEEKPFINSPASGKVSGYEDQQFENKQFKKFTISAVLKERDLIKQSNYFDESQLGDEINAKEDKARADFRIGDFEAFETFQVKTYLFDRNLTNKITN